MAREDEERARADAAEARVAALEMERDEAREWARMLLWQRVSREVRTSILVTRKLPAWLDPEVDP